VRPLELLMAENTKAHATNSHTEVPSAEHEQFPPFRRDTLPAQLFWFVVTFLLLYVLVAKFALPRVGGIIGARRGRIAGDLATANRCKEEADAAIVAYEKALAEARTRAQSSASETHEKLTAEAENNRKTLEARLHAKLSDAETAIAATKASAMTNVRRIALEAATTIVTRLTGASPPEATVAKALDDVLKR
jgi:F-type H+-transporting ATPase subunit b